MRPVKFRVEGYIITWAYCHLHTPLYLILSLSDQLLCVYTALWKHHQATMAEEENADLKPSSVIIGPATLKITHLQSFLADRISRNRRQKQELNKLGVLTSTAPNDTSCLFNVTNHHGSAINESISINVLTRKQNEVTSSACTVVGDHCGIEA